MIVTLSVAQLRELIRQEIKITSNWKSREPNRLLTASEAAEFLGYSKDWVYRHWKKIGGRKVGARGIRFLRSDLEKWAGSRTTT